jgi:DNA-binding response OmpR family regulator
MDLRVLVVCPDQESAKLLSLVLGEMEMTAEHATSISRGLERLNDENFEAVILDYRADLDSEEFLSKLRQTRKGLHTLLIAIVDGEFSARPLFGLGKFFSPAALSGTHAP